MEIKGTSLDIKYISTSGVYKTSFTLIILIEFFISAIIIILINLWFINSLYFLLTGDKFIQSFPDGYWWYWLLVPLNIYGNIFLFFVINMGISTLVYKILKLLHPPREGVFKKGSKDWKYMHRRFWTAYFPIWLARAIPLPWSDIFIYRLFGTKVGRRVVLYEGYIDPEFVEIGDDTMTSLHVCIFSHLIYHDKLIIKKVKIGKRCIIGAHTLILPGTNIKDEVVLGANSFTKPEQVLESNLIYIGMPANKSITHKSIEQSRIKAEMMKNTKDKK